jgi:hypothetical protein
MVNKQGETKMLTKDELKLMTIHQLAELIRKECADVGQYGEEYLADLLNTPTEKQEDAKRRPTQLGASQALSMACNSGLYRSENSALVKKELARRFKVWDKRQQAVRQKMEQA